MIKVLIDGKEYKGKKVTITKYRGALSKDDLEEVTFFSGKEEKVV